MQYSAQHKRNYCKQLIELNEPKINSAIDSIPAEMSHFELSRFKVAIENILQNRIPVRMV